MLDTLVQSKVGAMEALCAQNACEVSITTSVATPKPAICGHLKTGHRTDVRDKVFYSFGLQDATNVLNLD